MYFFLLFHLISCLHLPKQKFKISIHQDTHVDGHILSSNGSKTKTFDFEEAIMHHPHDSLHLEREDDERRLTRIIGQHPHHQHWTSEILFTHPRIKTPHPKVTFVPFANIDFVAVMRAHPTKSQSYATWKSQLPKHVKVIKADKIYGKHVNVIETGPYMTQNIRKEILEEHDKILDNLKCLYDRYQAVGYLLGHLKATPKTIQRALDYYKERLFDTKHSLNKQSKSLYKVLVELLECFKNNPIKLPIILSDKKEQIEKEVRAIQKALNMHKKYSRSLKGELQTLSSALGYDVTVAKSSNLAHARSKLHSHKQTESLLLHELERAMAVEHDLREKLNHSLGDDHQGTRDDAYLVDLENTLRSHVENISKIESDLVDNEKHLGEAHENIEKIEKEDISKKNNKAKELRVEAAVLEEEGREAMERSKELEKQASNVKTAAENLDSQAKNLEGPAQKQSIEAIKVALKNALQIKAQADMYKQEALDAQKEAVIVKTQSREQEFGARKEQATIQNQQVQELADDLRALKAKEYLINNELSQKTFEYERLSKELGSIKGETLRKSEIEAQLKVLSEFIESQTKELESLSSKIKDLQRKSSEKATIKGDPDFKIKRSKLDAFFKAKKQRGEAILPMGAMAADGASSLQPLSPSKTIGPEETIKCRNKGLAAETFFTIFPKKAFFCPNLSNILDIGSKLIHAITKDGKRVCLKSVLLFLQCKDKELCTEIPNERIKKLAEELKKILPIDPKFDHKNLQKNLIRCPSIDLSKVDKAKDDSLKHVLNPLIKGKNLRALIGFSFSRALKEEKPRKSKYTEAEVEVYSKRNRKLQHFAHYLPLIFEYLQTGNFELVLSEFSEELLAPLEIREKYGLGKHIEHLQHKKKKESIKKTPTIADESTVKEQALPSPPPKDTSTEPKPLSLPETTSESIKEPKSESEIVSSTTPTPSLSPDQNVSDTPTLATEVDSITKSKPDIESLDDIGKVPLITKETSNQEPSTGTKLSSSTEPVTD